MPRSAESAKILILIGLVLQAIEVGVLVVVGLLLFLVPFFGIVVGILIAFGVVWIVLVYLFSYRRVVEGDYTGARGPTLVFGILSLLTLNLISGILYLVGYAELGTAEQEMGRSIPAPPGYPATWSPAAPLAASAPSPQGPVRYCPRCGRPNAAGSRFCPSCGAPQP